MLSIYKASAGSGKTYTLTREYLRMLLSDKHPADGKQLPHSRILAVTFTKKSTAEMKERILRELFTLAHQPEQSDYLNEFLDDPHLHLTQQQIQQRAKILLIGILQDYARFSVSTIDGFFQQVIRTFALELGLSATYDIAMDSEEIIQQAVDDIFKRLHEENKDDKELIVWLSEFAQNNIDEDKQWNPSQLVKKFSKELFKEHLMRRMEAIQDVFTNKALIRQYKKQLKDICLQTEQTIAQLLQQANEVLASQEGWTANLIKVFQKTPEEWITGDIGNTFFKVLNDPTAAYVKKVSKAQQQQLAHIYDTQLEPIFQQLNHICFGTGACDYYTAKAILPHLYTMGILQDVEKQISDTNLNVGRFPISKTNQFVNQVIDGQDAPFIYERIGQYFRHFMIDEFQDTSALQWENFAPLIHETEDNHRDNLIVGDVKQSIYRFRNSDWHMLNNVEGEFHNTKVPKMEDNWRTAPIVIQENEKLLQLYSQYIADQLDQASGDPQISQDIRNIYSYDAMHQVAQKSYHGYFHMQFFEDKTYKEDSLKALDQLLQSLQQEGVDLKRVTLLVRRGTEAAELARFLVERNYSVQSAEGLRVGGHPAIKTIVNLLKDDWQDQQSVTRSAIEQFYGILTDQHIQLISQAQSLPLYERIQAIIDILNLPLMEGAAPYITAFQDIIYQFSNKRVADTKAFLDYWKRKEDKITIPAAKSTNTIQIMTIHSSKGLEFDIVIIPRLSWPLFKFHDDDILWCEPQTAPFNTLPLVPVHPEDALTLSHFKQEYIQEMKAQYMDNLNLTYVALTRPRYRLYAFGQKYSTKKDGTATIKNIGHLFSYLYDMNGDLNEQLIYAKTHDINAELAPLPPLKQQDNHNAIAQYISVPINQRLVLRSRSEDDFAEETTLSTINLGILMHLWLSFIHTWEDAEPSLKRLILGGQITQSQACELRLQLQQLQLLIQQHNHNDWFSGEYQIMAERDIFTPSGNMQRPDRVMIRGKHAIVIDYKFGQQKKRTYIEQVRDYMLLLENMGYTAEGYIIYTALNEISSVN